MTIGLVDDHELYLEGLRLLLEQVGHQVIFSMPDGASLLSALEKEQPDVLLCDIHLPDIQPEQLLIRIRSAYPALPVVYLTLMRGTRHLKKLQRHGIQGYLLKNAPIAELQEALGAVSAGKSYYSKDIQQTAEGDDYRQTIIVDENRVEDILTKREIEILQFICREMSNQQIANQLFLSVGTVDTHRKNIIQKLGVSNTVGLVRYALKHGIID